MDDATLKLLPDILSIVLRLIYDEVPWTLPELRLVSRSFNLLATPLVYRKWFMKTHNLKWRGSENVVENVRNYTRHAVFRSLQMVGVDYVDWDMVFDHFRGLPRLQKVTWDIHPKGRFTTCPIPTRMLGPKIEFCITNFHLWKGEVQSDHKLDITTIPTSNLVSFKSSADRALYRLGLQDQLVFSCPKLHTLHLALEHFNFDFSDHCPPLKELVLNGHEWTTDVKPIPPQWDLRSLIHLEVSELSIQQLFSRVHFEHLANVQVLRIEYSNLVSLQPINFLHTAGRFLRHIKALSEFKIKGDTARLDLGSLERHMKTLRILRIQDIIVLNKRPYGLPFEFMEYLSESSPNLEELEFDLEILGQDWRKFLPILSRFPALQKITVHVMPLRPRTFPQNAQTARAEFYADRKFTQDVVRHLIGGKTGRPFEEIKVFAKWYLTPPRGYPGGPGLRVRCFAWDSSVEAEMPGSVWEHKERGSGNQWDDFY